jgi:hypothetical protein
VRSKLLLSYNIRLQHQEVYMRFVINDLIPGLQGMGLKNSGVWHTEYGDYPIRLLEFVADSSQVMDKALGSEEFRDLEERLKSFVEDYSRRVVAFDSRFQF